MLRQVSMCLVSCLSRLPNTPDVFLHSPASDPQLVCSGMHPPVVLSPHGLVWGRGLVNAAVAEGLVHLPCVQVPAEPAWRLLETALRLEGRADGYSPEETARMLRFLRATGAGEEAIRVLDPLVRRNGGFVSPAEQYEGLPRLLQQLVEQGMVDLKTASAVTTLPEPAVAVFAGDASTLSASNRRLFLRQVYEVVQRDALSEAAAKAMVHETFRQPDPVGAVRRLRYPQLAEMESRLQRIVDSCVGGSGVRVEPPPYFEGDAFTLWFRFAGCESLAEKLRAAGRLVAECDGLFKLLR